MSQSSMNVSVRRLVLRFPAGSGSYSGASGQVYGFYLREMVSL